MYPIGTGTEEDFRKRWYIAYGFGEKASYGYHEGIDINLKTGGDTDLGEPILAIGDYKLVYYHLKSHLESGFGVHFVYEVDTIKGKRWVHCAHNQKDPAIFNKKQGKAGDVIAHIGKTGRPRNSLPAHLHFAVFKVDPGTLPNGIDTIAKTTTQLNNWWEDPQDTIANLKQEEETMPEWFKTFLQENNLTLQDEGKIREIFGKARDYDTKYQEALKDLSEAEDRAGDAAKANAILVEDKAKLEGRVQNLQESLAETKDELNKVSWELDKLEIEHQKVLEINEDLSKENYELREKGIEGLSKWELFLLLIRR